MLPDNDSRIQVFVGLDRTQLLAAMVLEHSAKRSCAKEINVMSMHNLPVPQPRDPRQSPSVGSSFRHFCVPQLAGYNGRAIYFGCPTLILKDMSELWSEDFRSHKILIQHNATSGERSNHIENRNSSTLNQQCAVMLIDCKNIDWDIERIVSDLNLGKYDCEKLMNEICLLKHGEIGEVLPIEWSSLELQGEGECNIRYPDKSTQPWVSTKNPFGNLWYRELRMMLSDGTISILELLREVKLGYCRPSLILDVLFAGTIGKVLGGFWNRGLELLDMALRYQPHKVVNETIGQRESAIRILSDHLDSAFPSVGKDFFHVKNQEPN